MRSVLLLASGACARPGHVYYSQGHSLRRRPGAHRSQQNASRRQEAPSHRAVKAYSLCIAQDDKGAMRRRGGGRGGAAKSGLNGAGAHRFSNHGWVRPPGP